MVTFLSKGACGTDRGTLPARRPGAGARSGRRGAPALGGQDPAGRFVLSAFRGSWSAPCYGGPVSLLGRIRLAVVQRGHVEGSLLTPVGPDAADQGPHLPAPAQPVPIGDIRV